MIVAVDVDGVCCDLHTEWFRRYNAEFNDDLTIDRVHQWDMIPAVKPECGKQIYKYFNDPDLYDNVQPVEGAKQGVAWLRAQGHRVIYVTSCTKGMADQKWEWLERHGFLAPTKGQSPDLILAHDKSLIKADALLDDYDANLAGWGSRGILLDAPYNRAAIGQWFRIRGWAGLRRVVRLLQRSAA